MNTATQSLLSAQQSASRAVAAAVDALQAAQNEYQQASQALRDHLKPAFKTNNGAETQMVNEVLGRPMNVKDAVEHRTAFDSWAARVSQLVNSLDARLPAGE